MLSRCTPLADFDLRETAANHLVESELAFEGRADEVTLCVPRPEDRLVALISMSSIGSRGAGTVHFSSATGMTGVTEDVGATGDPVLLLHRETREYDRGRASADQELLQARASRLHLRSSAGSRHKEEVGPRSPGVTESCVSTLTARSSQETELSRREGSTLF